MRFKQRMKVDLPQPEGPITAVAWRGAMPRLIPCSTRLSPNHAHSSRTVNLGEPALSLSLLGILAGPLLQAMTQQDRQPVQQQHASEQHDDAGCGIGEKFLLRARHPAEDL